MLEFRAVPVKRSLDEIYTVHKNGEWVFTIYFDLWSLLEDQYYVRLEAGRNIKNLTLADLRQLRRKFLTLNHTFVCNTCTAKDLKFARLFGFEPVGTLDERVVLEKS